MLDREFLYYLFNTTQVRGQISGSATGTKVRHTAPERIYRVRARVPDVRHQKTIAQTLKNYDELIAINRRRIEPFGNQPGRASCSALLPAMSTSQLERRAPPRAQT
jgi:restriction endonuclease S subunit